MSETVGLFVFIAAFFLGAAIFVAGFAAGYKSRD